MKIKVHIERLVLHGLPVSRSQGHLVQATLERELTQLLANGGLSDGLRAGGAVPALPAKNIRLQKDTQPGSVGKQIAGAVYGGIGSNRR
jgi:hypothetical protein